MPVRGSNLAGFPAMKTSRVGDAPNSVTDLAAGGPQQTQQEPLPARTMRPRILTIEKTGDAYAGKVRPRIRLAGRWLEKAGFKPGHRVQVEWIDDGVISLRLIHGSEAEGSEGPDGVPAGDPEAEVG
jgi:Toxin SymE, type I toxin-antitoxin system